MKLWRELFDPRGSDTLGARAQALAFELVVIYGVQADLFGWATSIPNQPGILAPAGIARYVDVSFMLNARCLQLSVFFTCAMLALGLLRLARGAYLLALVGYHLEYVARYSLGKLGHASNVLGFALLALGAADLAFRDPTLRRRASQGLMLILLSISYTWAGICKLLATGLGWPDGHHLQFWLREKLVDAVSAAGDVKYNPVQRVVLRHVNVATLMLTFGLLSELCSSLMLLRRARRWVLLSLCGMHMGILYAMDIAFMNNIYVLLSLALPIGEAVDALVKRYEARFARDASPV
ncbi:MAG TPA: hypothetical protein VMF89_23995 [Polyangiales bacterium]|nr:hypothetical protein [Polyangiales bacterium]